MVDVNAWIEKVHTLAREKGWWDTPRSVRHCLALIHSEASEALEAWRCWGNFTPLYEIDGDWDVGYRDGCKPEGVPSELADVVIRTLDLMGYQNLGWRQDWEGDYRFAESDDFAEHVFALHETIVMADDGKWETQRIVMHCQHIALRFGFDLWEAVARKHEYNATRPHRHGKHA